MNKRLLRQFHRWIGLIIGIQLLGWTLSGLYFTLIPIEEIRGNHLLKPAASLKLRHASMLSPNALIADHDELAEIHIEDIRIRQRLDRPAYVIDIEGKPAAYDAGTGDRLPPLTEADAINIAKGRSKIDVASAQLIHSVAPGSEYRGGELPAWQVSLVDDSNIYIGANSGQLRAVRTDEWRIFDLFWALHILDFEARADFNHFLVQLLAGLALVTVLSGFVLFFVTLRPRKGETQAAHPSQSPFHRT